MAGCRRVALIAVFCFLPGLVAAASPEILPVDQVTTGMKGIAKTVVTGTQIEEFGVEVLGVMKNKGPSGDLILVRTYGDVIDRTGGIAQGMSGSPVYIDGKLVGAIAYGWSLTDHRIGMVTPIADMLKLWDFPPANNLLIGSGAVPLPDSAVPVDTPLMASGFGGQAMELLKKELQPYHLVPYAVGEAPEGMTFAGLSPGSAVGVELVRGDISLGALGTVTYAEGDKVLAFGHPFLKKGAINYFMTNAYMFTTVSGLENSFKVGAVGQAIGVIQQDRGAGVAGQLDRYPNIIPLRVTVNDENLNRSRESAVQIVRDDQLAPVLTAATVFSLMEKTADRVGPGTAQVSFSIMSPDLPNGVMKRDNLFYSPANVGELAISEIHEALALLTGNQFKPVTIMDVQVSVATDTIRRTAAIMEAKAASEAANPGDTVNIHVQLKPFRGEPITRVVPFTIPKETKPGPLMLEVRGGGMISLPNLLLKLQGLDILAKAAKEKQKSLDDLVTEFSDRDRNNDLVVEVMEATPEEALNAPDALRGAGKGKPKSSPEMQLLTEKNVEPDAEKSALKPEEQKPVKARTKIDYIIDSGDAQLAIMVNAAVKNEKVSKTHP